MRIREITLEKTVRDAGYGTFYSMLDLYKVKCLMELIESKILVFKAEQMERMKELEMARRTCYHDIKMMEDRISKADYNSLDSSLSTSTATSKIHDSHFSFDKNASGLLPAVVEFQVILKTGV